MTTIYEEVYLNLSDGAKKKVLIPWTQQEDGSWVKEIGITFAGELNVDAITDEELRASPVPMSLPGLYIADIFKDMNAVAIGSMTTKLGWLCLAWAALLLLGLTVRSGFLHNL